MKVITIKESEFDSSVLNSDKKVLVDFYADWCGPCKMLGPIIEELSEENDDYSYVKINVDEAENISRQYGVMSIPTLIIFENKEVSKKSVGFKTKDELKDFLEIK